MKTLIIKFASVIFILISMTGALHAGRFKITWEKDIESAMEKAKEQDRIIMIDVYTDWCGWCKELDKTTYKDRDVIRLSDQFINLKVNPEDSVEEQEFVENYPVEGYPTILFINNEGKLIGTIGGYLEGEDFAEMMEFYLTMEDKVAELQKQYTEGNAESILELIEIYNFSGNTEELERTLYDLKDWSILSEDQQMNYKNFLAYQCVVREDLEQAVSLFQEVIDTFDPSIDLYQHNFAAYYIADLLQYVEDTETAHNFITDYIENTELDENISAYLYDLQDSLSMGDIDYEE